MNVNFRKKMKRKNSKNSEENISLKSYSSTSKTGVYGLYERKKALSFKFEDNIRVEKRKKRSNRK